MLKAIYVEWHKLAFYAECFYAARHYTDCRYAECRGALKYPLLISPWQYFFRLRPKFLVGTNTLAYYSMHKITTVKAV